MPEIIAQNLPETQISCKSATKIRQSKLAKKEPPAKTSQVALLLIKFGGDKRDRTADLLNAIQALSQLSYAPNRLTIGIISAYFLAFYTFHKY